MKTVIMMSALPFSGKTTLGKNIQKMYDDAIYIDGDQFSYPRKFFQQLKKVFTNHDVIIVGKCHHNQKTRASTLNILDDTKIPYNLIVVNICIDPIEDTLPKLLQRAEERGISHTTLQYTKYNHDKVVTVLNGFISSMSPFSIDEHHVDRIIDIPFDLSIEEQCQIVAEHLGREEQ